MEDVLRLEKELKSARTKAAGEKAADLMQSVREVGGVKIIAARVDAPDRETLATWAEQYRDKLERGVVALASSEDGKVTIIVAVSKDLTPKVHAGKIVQAMSEAVGGKGGGRPDFAQGGGSDVSKIEEALKKVFELLK
jgi:alanyl-tRNA synthetase